MSAPYQSELCHALDPTYANGVQIHLHSQATKCQSQNVIEEDDSSDQMYNVSVAHTCSTMVLCQWVNESTSETCDAEISCGAVIPHFRNIHGIRPGRLEDPAKIKIRCLWRGCPKRIGQKNFLRHIAEHHLHHSRS
ncbi:hypothetical protein HD554DRAFT_2038445 [Boletus coccyginus]|nr:hypothetical protein HD554DRAFT_2038445 [Boletus coccyginus]